jgi:hypothetical protein
MIRRPFLLLLVSFLLVVFASPLHAQAEIDLKLLAGMEARSIGPAGMSGRIADSVAVESNPDIIYVGTASGGLWMNASGPPTWPWTPPTEQVDRGDVGASALAMVFPLRRARVEEAYLHIDIDVLDPAVAPGVDYRYPGGLSLEEMDEAIRLIAAQVRVKAAALTAYNPDYEEDDRTLKAGLHLVTLLAAAATASGST